MLVSPQEKAGAKGAPAKAAPKAAAGGKTPDYSGVECADARISIGAVALRQTRG